LPELLFDDEVQRLQEAAAQDARCHCLVYLVLHAGLKKEEVKGLKLDQIDLSDPRRHGRHTFPRLDRKATSRTQPRAPRQLRNHSQAIPGAVSPYRELFACTDRNLNYILRGP